MLYIDGNEENGFEKRNWIKLINCLSGAKSANLIGSISQSQNLNLAIISSVFHIGASPPLMGFLLRPHSDKSPRHTFQNIIENNQFTINHVHSEIVKEAHQTSARYERQESEFGSCGLTPIQKGRLIAPYVKESRIQIGLSLVETLKLKVNSTNLIIGKIEEIYFNENILREDGSLDLNFADSVAVTGLDEYHKINQLTRLSYAKPNSRPKEIKSELVQEQI